ncbi:PH domain-containing protein [Algivirga pacifica]|uniref:Uncharacterized protein YyaB-like PH domain-containing protein n=1 Tax=Algivirga pacifica TaxID=1162670 RepID=A0ABP9DJM2_9BACT
MKTYKSKFGYGIIGFVVLILSSILLFMIYQNESTETIVSVAGIHLLVLGFCLYLNFSTKYTITDQGLLKVRCGFLYSKEIDVMKIKSIKKSNNLISSPAPSLDRVEVAYGKYDVVIISPKKKVEFADHLTQINPSIENCIDGIRNPSKYGI